MDTCRQFAELGPDAQRAYFRLLLGPSAQDVDPHEFASKCESGSDRQASIDLNYVRGDGRYYTRTPFCSLDSNVTASLSPRILGMSWDGPLMVDGTVIESANFMRYDNDYSQVEWGSQVMQINSGNYSILLDFPNGNILFD